MLGSEEPQEMPVIQYRELCYRISNVVMEADSILRQKRFGADSIGSLMKAIQAGISLNEKMQAWDHQAYGVYAYKKIDVAQVWPASSPFASTGPIVAHIYNTISIGSLWNAYRTTRIYLLRCLIPSAWRLAKEAGLASEEAMVHCDSITRMKHQIQRLADDICASVPYILGEIDQEGNVARIFPNNNNKAIGGLFLLWPLGSLLPLDSLPREQIAWIRERLAYIYNALGIQQAMTIVRVVKP